MRARPRRAPLLVGAVLLTGCSGDPASSAGSPPAAATPSAAPTASASPSDCPVPVSARAAFPELPADFPADFPAPPGAVDAVSDDSDPAVVSVRFPSPTSLRDAVRFVLDRLPANGFEITDGDREPHEADVVFAQGELRGQLRIARVDECTTFWLVQVVRPG